MIRPFTAMVREEWRLHARLFGGRRFAAFPLVIAAVGAVGAWGLATVGTTTDAVVAGVHALAFAVGLQVGTVGLVGRDAMEDLLGEMTLLVFSARTLPVSRRRLLGTFFVKDLLYYAGFFMLPLSVALLAAGVGIDAALIWLTLTATFGLGAATSFAGVALATRFPGPVVGLSLVGVTALGYWTMGAGLVEYLPYGLYLGTVRGLVGIAAVPAAVAAGILAYEPGSVSTERTRSGGFGRWRRRLGDDSGLTTKTLLEVARSSGGLWKPLFSGGVIFAVAAYLVATVEEVIAVDPSTGITVGALLGLTAFTSYNWLTIVDDVEEYLLYPVTLAAVFRAKLRAFLLLGPAVGVAYLAGGGVLFGLGPVEGAVGLVVLVGVQLYLFGLTVYLTGFDPNSFLFDPLLFSAFGVAVAVVLVPVLVVGLVVDPVPTTAWVGLTAGSFLVGGVGLALYRRAPARWERKLRG